MKKAAVTVEFVVNVPDCVDLDTIRTSIRDVGDVVHFEALVDGKHKVVGAATDYETISAAVLEDVYQDEGSD